MTTNEKTEAERCAQLDELGRLRKIIEQQRAQIGEYAAERADLLRGRFDLTVRVEKLEGHNAGLTARLAEIQGTYAETVTVLQRERDEAIAQANSLRSMLADQRKIITAERDEARRYKEEAGALSARVDAAVAERDSAVIAHGQQVSAQLRSMLTLTLNRAADAWLDRRSSVLVEVTREAQQIAPSQYEARIRELMEQLMNVTRKREEERGTRAADIARLSRELLDHHTAPTMHETAIQAAVRVLAEKRAEAEKAAETIRQLRAENNSLAVQRERDKDLIIRIRSELGAEPGQKITGEHGAIARLRREAEALAARASAAEAARERDAAETRKHDLVLIGANGRLTFEVESLRKRDREMTDRVRGLSDALDSKNAINNQLRRVLGVKSKRFDVLSQALAKFNGLAARGVVSGHEMRDILAGVDESLEALGDEAEDIQEAGR